MEVTVKVSVRHSVWRETGIAAAAAAMLPPMILVSVAPAGVLGPLMTKFMKSMRNWEQQG